MLIYLKQDIRSRMATCQHCGAFVLLPFRCNHCGLEFCPNCRLPPDHDCAGLDSWRGTSAPHAFVKMDRLHHPELWGSIRPGSRSFGDERSDPRFYPPGDSFQDYCRPNIPGEQPLCNLDRHEQIFNPGPRLEGEGWPSAYRGLRDWVHKRYQKFAYDMWQLWRFIRKNWFWILVAIATAYIYISTYGGGVD